MHDTYIKNFDNLVFFREMKIAVLEFIIIVIAKKHELSMHCDDNLKIFILKHQFKIIKAYYFMAAYIYKKFYTRRYILTRKLKYTKNIIKESLIILVNYNKLCITSNVLCSQISCFFLIMFCISSCNNKMIKQSIFFLEYNPLFHKCIYF